MKKLTAGMNAMMQMCMHCCCMCKAFSAPRSDMFSVTGKLQYAV